MVVILYSEVNFLSSDSRHMFWLFQGNPKYYRVVEAIHDFAEMPWPVTRYAKLITPGDQVLVWICGTQAGIYALAEVTTEPELMPHPPDLQYWIDKSRVGQKPQVMLRFTQKWLEQPLRRIETQQDEVLKDLAVLRQPNCTNYKVTTEQWHKVLDWRGAE